MTQWNISAIPYDDNSSAFKGSHMEMWLNDTSVDGFLGNLREPENFIKMDSKWNATMTTGTSKPSKTTIVEDPVGLLNIYEYVMSYTGTTAKQGYLNNGLQWYSLTPCNATQVKIIYVDGSFYDIGTMPGRGIRPSINLKSGIKTVDGKGTEEDPYRLKGDNDKSLSGTLISSRYSGEYISFGTGENNLYRIVSHETEGQTKITSSEPLKENSKVKTLGFGPNSTFSSSNTTGKFLNNDYLNNGTYLTSEQKSMIEDNATWYLGTVADGQNYRLAKYKDVNMSSLTSNTTTAKVGLLRVGELMAGQIGNRVSYWQLTPTSSLNVRRISGGGNSDGVSAKDEVYGIKPVYKLKSNVIIISGDGTIKNPFEVKLDI